MKNVNLNKVLAGNIGICGHCFIFVVARTVAEIMAKKEKCWRCGKSLSPRSFGYREVVKGAWMKIKWIGKHGWWTTLKPLIAFRVGRWEVVTQSSETER